MAAVTEQGCHVHVMSAGVHDADIASGIVFGADLAGIRQARLLLHWKRIEFSAKHHGRAVAILQNGDDSSSAYVFGHRVAEVAKPPRQLRCRLGFMGRQFGILVDIEIQSFGVGVNGFDFGGFGG